MSICSSWFIDLKKSVPIQAGRTSYSIQLKKVYNETAERYMFY